jgi:Zn-dependent protease
MIFLPFLGALAMPRLPYETQAQAVFSALMGPGFSLLLAFALSLPFVLGVTLPAWLVTAGVVVIGLNLFNLLPVEPLDGGVALRSILARLMGTHARFGLLTIGLALLAGGFYFEQVILLIFGGISVLANLRPRLIDHGLKPLSFPGVLISAFAFVTTVAAYSVMLAFFLGAFR